MVQLAPKPRVTIECPSGYPIRSAARKIQPRNASILAPGVFGSTLLWHRGHHQLELVFRDGPGVLSWVENPEHDQRDDKRHRQVDQVERQKEGLGDWQESVDVSSFKDRVSGRGEDQRSGTREAPVPHRSHADIGGGNQQADVGLWVTSRDERDEER